MNNRPCNLTRRHFLAQNSLGIGGLALAWLLNEDKLLGAPGRPELEQRRFDLTPKRPHFEPKARALPCQSQSQQLGLLQPQRPWPQEQPEAGH